jgi:hypothetical protein
VGRVQPARAAGLGRGARGRGDPGASRLEEAEEQEDRASLFPLAPALSRIIAPRVATGRRRRWSVPFAPRGARGRLFAGRARGESFRGRHESNEPRRNLVVLGARLCRFCEMRGFYVLLWGPTLIWGVWGGRCGEEKERCALFGRSDRDQANRRSGGAGADADADDGAARTTKQGARAPIGSSQIILTLSDNRFFIDLCHSRRPLKRSAQAQSVSALLLTQTQQKQYNDTQTHATRG